MWYIKAIQKSFDWSAYRATHIYSDIQVCRLHDIITDRSYIDVSTYLKKNNTWNYDIRININIWRYFADLSEVIADHVYCQYTIVCVDNLNKILVKYKFYYLLGLGMCLERQYKWHHSCQIYFSKMTCIYLSIINM